MTSKIDLVKRAVLAMQRAAWEQGVVAQAFLEQGETEHVLLMAHDAVVRQYPDGRLGMLGSDDAVTDPAANGEPVLFAGRITQDSRYFDAAERMLHYLLHTAPKTQEGILHHILSRPQIWVDSMYMAPPFLAAAGQPAEAVRQISGMRALLWDSEKHLLSHIWDDGKKAFARHDFWGVGNGWAAAGMVRVIAALPERLSAEKMLLIGYLRELVDGLLVYWREDGLFFDVVDNPSTFVETNLAQMLAYSIYRAVKAGWLDGSYREKADRMRSAAHGKVDPYGLVQGVCGSPMFDHSGTAAEGQSFFLLMEAAYSQL